LECSGYSAFDMRPSPSEMEDDVEEMMSSMMRRNSAPKRRRRATDVAVAPGVIMLTNNIKTDLFLHFEKVVKVFIDTTANNKE
jgi:hypothetical protein